VGQRQNSGSRMVRWRKTYSRKWRRNCTMLQSPRRLFTILTRKGSSWPL